MRAKKRNRIIIRVVATMLLPVFSGCFSIHYGFKGGTLPTDLETLSVQYFDNRAPLVEPSLSQAFTDALREFIEGNTKLRTINGLGDVDFSGEIKNYRITPSAISADDNAAKTRFMITIRVKYTNSKYPDDSFDSSFSRFRDFDSTEDFSSVQLDLTEEIIDEIIDQIYNKAFVNW